MRVRVRFRYRAETGEVEAFLVEDVSDGPRAADHDARHEAAALDVARVVDPNALVTEELPGTGPLPAPEGVAHPADSEPATPEERRLRG